MDVTIKTIFNVSKFLFILNTYHAVFLKWNNPSLIFGTVHYDFRDIKMRT